MLMTGADIAGVIRVNNKGNKEYKYKNIIAPLVLEKKVGTRINKRVDLPRSTLNDNKIDYIHWD